MNKENQILHKGKESGKPPLISDPPPQTDTERRGSASGGAGRPRERSRESCENYYLHVYIPFHNVLCLCFTDM